MAHPTDVPALAKELGVRINDILDCAHEIGLPIRRGAARLTAAQANRLREEREAGRLTRRSSSSRPQYSPPPPKPPPTDVFKCSCCGFRFSHDADGDLPEHCSVCVRHYPKPNEPDSRAIERLTEHDGRWRQRVDFASKKATEYENRMRSALRSRDTWKRVLVEIVVAHEPLGDGGCCCGAANFPCVTRRQLEDSNKGIAREIEKLESLGEEELSRFLHGDDDLVSDWDAYTDY